MYNKLIGICNSDLKIAYDKIHEALNTLPRYTYRGNGEFSGEIPKGGGVYIIFEKGVKYGGYDRITRVGKAEKSLLARLQQHFVKEDKDHSIFRKHVGRALLNKKGLPLDDWNKKGVDVPDIEKKVSEYLKDNATFCVIPLADKNEICILEKTLIEVLAAFNRSYLVVNGKAIQSDNWLGNHSANQKIKSNGLWNV